MATEVDDGYFNDLSRQPRTSNDSSSSPSEQNCTTGTYDQSELPKTKRIACVICRKRKLKCDGNRPKCATCARLGHNCTYDEVRKKSGPKRGYVKELEARLGMHPSKFFCRYRIDSHNSLAQVETQLQGKAAKKDRPHAPERQRSVPEEAGMQDAIPEINQPMPQSSSAQMTDVAYSTMGSSNSPFIAPNSNMLPEAMTTSDFAPDMSFGLDDNFSWEMIGLGLEEPLPMQEAIDELYVQCLVRLTVTDTIQYQRILRKMSPLCTHASQIPVLFINEPRSASQTASMSSLRDVVFGGRHNREVHASPRYILSPSTKVHSIG